MSIKNPVEGSELRAQQLLQSLFPQVSAIRAVNVLVIPLQVPVMVIYLLAHLE
jgi:hypothetical protein